jgi:hypothetical protein
MLLDRLLNGLAALLDVLADTPDSIATSQRERQPHYQNRNDFLGNEFSGHD